MSCQLSTNTLQSPGAAAGSEAGSADAAEATEATCAVGGGAAAADAVPSPAPLRPVPAWCAPVHEGDSASVAAAAAAAAAAASRPARPRRYARSSSSTLLSLGSEQLSRKAARARSTASQVRRNAGFSASEISCSRPAPRRARRSIRRAGGDEMRALARAHLKGGGLDVCIRLNEEVAVRVLCGVRDRHPPASVAPV